MIIREICVILACSNIMTRSVVSILFAICQKKNRYFVSFGVLSVAQVLNVDILLINVHRLLFTVDTYYF